MSMANEGTPGFETGNVPVPDPTALTTDAVNAARVQWRLDTQALKELIMARIDAVEEKGTAGRGAIDRQIKDLQEMLDERYRTQTKALDAAFVAQETAVSAALANAEKAVTKAEAATEKRFEAVDKFRTQLADQAATLMSRNEATVRIDSVNEKLDADTQRIQQRLNELELRVTSRLDLAEGNKQGSSSTIATIIAAVSVIVAIIVAVAIISAR